MKIIRHKSMVECRCIRPDTSEPIKEWVASCNKKKVCRYGNWTYRRTLSRWERTFGPSKSDDEFLLILNCHPDMNGILEVRYPED